MVPIFQYKEELNFFCFSFLRIKNKEVTFRSEIKFEKVFMTDIFLWKKFNFPRKKIYDLYTKLSVTFRLTLNPLVHLIFSLDFMQYKI